MTNDTHHPSPSTRHVRFIGGPYDGHWQEEAAPMADRLSLLVSRDVFADLEGLPREGAPITSIALYALDVTREAYLFLRPLAP